jgi:hypothetical protein
MKEDTMSTIVKSTTVALCGRTQLSALLFEGGVRLVAIFSPSFTANLHLTEQQARELAAALLAEAPAAAEKETV